MRYQAAGAYLLGTINETASRRQPHRLERMAAFLEHLGNPHLAYPTVHVGGTSGKGSTSAMIATALTASGLRTALHTKPHLTSMTERARIDGGAISEERFAEILTAMMPAIEATTREYERPSYYETLLAIAFVYFQQEAVDIAVIEVGIGGTLDGTNLIAPEVSVITNVGLDHTEILGDTVEAIAADKAGIAKAGVPLVCDATGSARSIIEDACRRAHAPFIGVHDRARVAQRPSEPYGQSFTVQTPRGTYELALPVLGRFQQRNAATAIVALEQLREGLRPSLANIEAGFAQLVVPGRMELFPGHPSLVLDVAHNPDKAMGLAEALLETFPDRRFVFVVAIAETKDAAAIVRPWFGLPASFVFTTFETPGRAAVRPDRLINIAAIEGVAGRAIADPIEALNVARRSAGSGAVIVVTGSTFVVGTIRDWWTAHAGDRQPR